MKRQRIVLVALSILVLSFAVAYIQTIAIAEQAKLQEDNNVNFLWTFALLKKSINTPPDRTLNLVDVLSHPHSGLPCVSQKDYNRTTLYCQGKSIKVKDT